LRTNLQYLVENPGTVFFAYLRIVPVEAKAVDTYYYKE